ncbi:MAG: mannosyltransferase family protein, partial [Ilumatobacteraceae bacterium]
MTETLDPPLEDLHDSSAIWYRILRKVGLVYIFSRMCVLAGAAIVAAELQVDINQAKGVANLPFADPSLAGRPLPTSALGPMSDVLSSWDGIWYLRIVRIGYPRHVQPHVTYFVADARAAFFPAYPMLVRLVDKILPGGDTLAALSTNFVLGAVAILLLGLVAKRLYGPQVAAKAMVLGAMFPGSFVLSFAYTEALLLVLAMGCLWCLMSKRWIVAGLLAALGTATRPNGLA